MNYPLSWRPEVGGLQDSTLQNQNNQLKFTRGINLPKTCLKL